MLAGVNGYKAVQALTRDKEGNFKGNVASVSITAGYSFTESSEQQTISIPVPPTIRCSSVTIAAVRHWRGVCIPRMLSLSSSLLNSSP
ncbi:hypothetical protein NXC24_PA00170 (plasmid) [Rhizobium sp. NXC24]|nr:hypothetical protein NXC24_PA00170 [Rhizobium sp. NXC24]